jgi:NADH-quinone oxidoreductase subunit M
VQKVAPILAGLFLVAGLSSLALPGLSSFVSEFLVLAGTFTVYPVPAIIATGGIVLAALYILLMYQRTMTGPVQPGVESMPDLRGREVLALAPVIAIIIALGFFPQAALDVINPSVDQTMTIVGSADPAPAIAEGK